MKPQYAILIMKFDKMEGTMVPYIIEGPMSLPEAMRKLDVLKSLNMGSEFRFFMNVLLPNFTETLSNAVAPRGWSFIPAGTDAAD